MSPLFRRGRKADSPATEHDGQHDQRENPPELEPDQHGEQPDEVGGRSGDGSPGEQGTAGEAPATAGASTGAATAGEGGTGPFDADDPNAPTTGLMDLGGLRVPAVAGLQLRLDVEKSSGTVVAVTLVSGASVVQLTAFAAPRSSGLWQEIREESTAAVAKAGGSAETVEGSYGEELVVRRPVTLKDGRQAVQIQRVCAVEGPRWLLRAVFTGPDVLKQAGVEVPADVAAKGGSDLLDRVVRGTVVVRGSKPMAPRDRLPLVLPEAARQAAAKQQAATGTPGSPGTPAAAGGTAAAAGGPVGTAGTRSVNGGAGQGQSD